MYSPIPQLNAMKDLQDEVGELSCAFWLRDFNDPALLADFPYRTRLVPFAVADDVVYAIWLVEGHGHLEYQPIVAFSEHGRQVVGGELRDLVRLLTYDARIVVTADRACYSRDEDVLSDGHVRLVRLLHDEYRMMPVTKDADAERVVTNAQETYNPRFGRFLMGDFRFSPVPELNSLKELQDELGELSDGFWLNDFDNKRDLVGWAEPGSEPASRLLPFATANGTGSVYAIWRMDDRADLATLPIVVLGDEGGEYVVARDLPEFVRHLTLDTEIMVDDNRAYYFRDEDDDEDEYSDGHEDLVDWLRDRYGLEPADEAESDRIMKTTEEAFGARFRGILPADD